MQQQAATNGMQQWVDWGGAMFCRHGRHARIYRNTCQYPPRPSIFASSTWPSCSLFVADESCVRSGPQSVVLLDFASLLGLQLDWSITTTFDERALVLLGAAVQAVAR